MYAPKAPDSKTVFLVDIYIYTYIIEIETTDDLRA